jgi:hypothetical protein
MKNIQNFKVILLAFMVFSIFSCKKEKLPENPIASTVNIAEILLDRAAFEKRMLSKDGYIRLSVSTVMGSSRGTPTIYATFKDQSGDKKSYGKLFVGTYELDYDKSVDAYDNSLDFSNGDYLKTLFGSNVTFQLKAATGTADEVNEKLYIPKKLDVVSPLTYSVGKNATFVWNADNSNSLGVGIAVSFDPKALGNEKFTNLKALTKVTQATDNGSYTFDPNDLSAFPTGAKLEFTITRGNFSELKGKVGGNYLLYTASTTTGFYELK